MTTTSQTSTLLLHNMNLVNQGNDQYFRIVTRLARVVDWRRSGKNMLADKEQVSALTALNNLKSNLATFSSIDHAGLDAALAEAVVRDWGNLISQGVDPMFQKAQANALDEYQRYAKETVPALSRQFGASVNAFNKAGSDKFAEAGARFQQITAIGQNILLTGLVAGLLLFFTDRYLVACLVKPPDTLREHFSAIASGQLGKPIHDFGRNCVGRLLPLL